MQFHTELELHLIFQIMGYKYRQIVDIIILFILVVLTLDIHRLL